MEYYLTTYTKDYKWPVTHSPYKEKKNAENRAKLVQEQIKPEPCAVYKSQPLEDPIIDPAQCGAPPAGPESKYGQPLTYLRKLYLKYPYLYQILKLTPPEELAKTIYSDKYISTYNADFKVQGFSPLKNWLAPEQDKGPNEAQKAGLDWPANEKICGDCGITDQPSYGQPPPQQEVAAKFVGIDNRRDERTTCGCVENAKEQMKSAHPVKKIARKPCTISRIPRVPHAASKKQEDKKRPPEYTGGSHPPKLGKWKTEYRDTISKVGGIIITKKLHSRLPLELTEQNKK